MEFNGRGNIRIDLTQKFSCGRTVDSHKFVGIPSEFFG